MSTFWATIAGDRWIWAGLACVMFVCVPLILIAPGADWGNHVWMVDYHARYFVSHGWFPTQLNTDQIVGMNFPVFYGYLFYKLMALISTVTSGNLSLRILAVLLLSLQFILTYKTSLQWTNNRLFAFTLGTLATWSIYPLTNLYNRGAVTEFFACGLLTCACVALVQALWCQSRRQLWLWCNFSVLCLCICAGTHPITALYGLLFYGGLAGIGLYLQGGKRAKELALALAVPGLLATVCLAPWVVSTARYSKSLDIAYSFREVSYFPKSIDGLPLRLCPISLPIYSLRHKAADENMGTPGLDAEINMPMLVLLLFAAVGLFRQKRLRPAVSYSIVGLVALASWLTYMSCVQHALDQLGYYAGAIQFAYRLVTYINLAIFSAIILAVSQSAKNSTETVEQTVSASNANAGRAAFVAPQPLVFLLVVGFVAMLFKLHATQKLDPITYPMFADQLTDKEILQLPFGFYGHQNYSVPALLQLRTDLDGNHLDSIKLLPGRGSDFGIVEPVSSSKQHRGWSITNVQPFPWNRLSLNGDKLSAETAAALRTVTILPSRPLQDAKSICIKDLPQGSLQYSFKPDRDWEILNAIALPVFFIWLGATAIGSIIVSFLPSANCGSAPSAVQPQPAAVASP